MRYIIFIVVTFLSQKLLYGQLKGDTFYLRKEKGRNYLFVYSKFDLTKRINLYEDKMFSFETNSLNVLLNFSSGTWDKINDSTIYLKSDKKIFDKIFFREQRQREKSRYSYVNVSNYYLIIPMNSNYAILLKKKKR